MPHAAHIPVAEPLRSDAAELQGRQGLEQAFALFDQVSTQLSQSYNLLEARVTERTAQLQSAKADAEAANLLRFQQAFQASGRVMQAASDIFDTLLGIG